MQLSDLLGSSTFIFFVCLFCLVQSLGHSNKLTPRSLGFSPGLWLLEPWRPYVLPRKMGIGQRLLAFGVLPMGSY